MKILFKSIMAAMIAILLSSKIHAQTCKIIINYDNNGCRIQRIKDCSGGRAAPPDSSNIALVVIDSLNTTPTGIFQIYPNPTNTSVTIFLDAISLQSPCDLTIMDATGRAFKKQILTDGKTVMDLSGFTDGSYYFRLQRGSKVNTVKVEKIYGLDN